jgi:S1-C subfamily serine protease
MKHILVSILVALMTAGCSISCSPIHKKPKEPSTLVSHVSDATVALVYTKVNEEDSTDEHTVLETKPFCTGVWIDRYRILTAGHCIVGLADHEGTDTDGLAVHYVLGNEVDGPFQEPLAVHLGKEIALDTEHDLALIVARGGNAVPAHSIARLANQPPGIGEDLLFVGHPSGLYFTVLKGSVAAYFDDISIIEKTGPWMQIEAPIWYGNSGGGAFNTDGELVGVCSWKAPFPSTAFYVHLNTIRAFILAQK